MKVIPLILSTILFSCTSVADTAPSNQYSPPAVDLSIFEHNTTHFYKDTNSLFPNEARELFHLPDEFDTHAKIAKEVNMTGTKLILLSKGYNAGASIDVLGDTAKGEFSKLEIMLLMLSYRDIELTAEQLTALQKKHPFGDSITSATMLYGSGIELTATIKSSSSSIDISKGLGSVAGKAEAGFYELEIQQNTMGALKGKSVGLLLDIIESTDSLKASKVILSKLKSAPDLLDNVEIKRLGYLYKYDPAILARINSQKKSSQQSQQQGRYEQQQIQQLGNQQQQQQQRQEKITN
jgi:hypothetical protein